MKMFHATKPESMYAGMSDIDQYWGGVQASNDKDAGHRFNIGAGQKKPGVYGAEAKYLQSTLDCYLQYAPLFGDGAYVACYLRCLCDEAYAVHYKHDDQKVQMALKASISFEDKRQENQLLLNTRGAFPIMPEIL